MSQFSLEVIEPLSYDFRQIPSNKGGMCAGHGVLEEPTQPMLDAYADGTRKLFGVKDGESPALVTKRMEEELKAKTGKEQKAAAEKITHEMIKLTSALCGGTPSVDELTELPPRARNAFVKWVQKEIGNPEV